MNRGNARALWLLLKWLHLIDHFEHEQQLTIGGARRTVEHFRLTCKVGQREFVSGIQQRLLMINLLLIRLPRLAIGRIGDLIAKGLPLEMVIGNGVAKVHATWVNALDNEVGFADGVGLWVDLST